MHDYNYLTAVDLGYDATMANKSAVTDSYHTGSLIDCSSRDYNLTQYESTVVTEVCNSGDPLFQCGSIDGHISYFSYYSIHYN